MATVARLLRSPRATLDGAERDGTIASSLGFAALAYGVGLLPSAGFYFAALSPALREASTAPLGAASVVAAFVFGVPALMVLQLFTSAALELAMLRVLGVRTATFGRALRAHAFGAAAFGLGLVPLLGPPIATVWAIAIRVFAVRRFQEVTSRQAVLSVLAPLLFLCGVSVLVLVALLAG